MSSFPYSNPSALFETEKFNIDNANHNMSAGSFPIYSVFDEPAFNDESKSSKSYVDYENPIELLKKKQEAKSYDGYVNPIEILKKKQESNNVKKINKINKQYYNLLAMEEIFQVIPKNEINNMKLTKTGVPKLNSKYGKQYKEILKRIMDEDKK